MNSEPKRFENKFSTLIQGPWREKPGPRGNTGGPRYLINLTPIQTTYFK